MADRIQEYPWGTSRLGPIEEWPLELLTIVNQMLASREIATVFWGPDRLMLYNEHYISQLGERHPALGQPLREVWPDVVDQVAPLIDSVFQEGRSAYLDDTPLVVIEDGERTERFYTASFEPIWVRRGVGMAVEGVYQVAINNTPRIQAEVQAQEAQRAFQQTAEHLALAVEAGDLATWYYDPAQVRSLSAAPDGM